MGGQVLEQQGLVEEPEEEAPGNQIRPAGQALEEACDESSEGGAHVVGDPVLVDPQKWETEQFLPEVQEVEGWEGNEECLQHDRQPKAGSCYQDLADGLQW